MNERDIRDCFASFTTGVMVATTTFEDKNYGLTINSFASVSLDPPLLLFSIDNKSSNLDIFKKSGKFALSILSEKQIALAQEFAKPLNDNKWTIERYFFNMLQVPVFQNSLAFFECKTNQIFAVGDHHIFIGQISACKRLNKGNPLLYLNSGFLSF